MKRIKLFFVALLLNSCVLFAQSSGEDINNIIPATLYQQLDKTEITSGILINQSTLFTDHTRFYKDSLGIADYSIWKQLYLEIFNGYFIPPFHNALDSIKSKIGQYQQNGITPLLIMDITYHQIPLAAFEDSLLYIEEDMIKDVFPRSASPYQTERIISFAPSTDIIFQEQFTFLFSKQFFFSNQPNEPQTIEIDFADGNGFRQVQWENTYSRTIYSSYVIQEETC